MLPPTNRIRIQQELGETAMVCGLWSSIFHDFFQTEEGPKTSRATSRLCMASSEDRFAARFFIEIDLGISEGYVRYDVWFFPWRRPPKIYVAFFGLKLATGKHWCFWKPPKKWCFWKTPKTLVFLETPKKKTDWLAPALFHLGPAWLVGLSHSKLVRTPWLEGRNCKKLCWMKNEFQMGSGVWNITERM